MALFARSNEPVLRGFLTLKHGTPSRDTFSRLFRLLDPEQFRTVFQHFTARFSEAIQGVAVIGKDNSYTIRCIPAKPLMVRRAGVDSPRIVIPVGSHRTIPTAATSQGQPSIHCQRNPPGIGHQGSGASRRSLPGWRASGGRSGRERFEPRRQRDFGEATRTVSKF